MHSKTDTARQASPGGNARHVEITQRAAPPVHGDLHIDEPSAAVRIPPFAVAQDNSWARQGHCRVPWSWAHFLVPCHARACMLGKCCGNGGLPV